MTTSTATVPTASGSRYLQQLCKHWSHKLQVDFTPVHGSVVFPKDIRGANYDADAVVTFDARAEALDVRIEASSKDHLGALQRVVADH